MNTLTAARNFEAVVRMASTLSTVTFCQMSLSHCLFKSFSQYESVNSSKPRDSKKINVI